jgi:probable F420-dependent oxidoreductase
MLRPRRAIVKRRLVHDVFMSSQMRLAIAIPQTFADGAFDPAALRTYLARAEALGFDGAWTSEAVFSSMPFLESVDMLTYAAALTERLRLGCAVMLIALRGPVHLAKRLSTLDQLSRGRLEIGVGLGGRIDVYPAFAADASTRVARFNEGLRLMKELWTQPEVTFDGRFWQLNDAAMEPKPFQKPYPPIWFGANHANALRRAVRHGDGFIGGGSTPTARFVEQVSAVRTLLDEANRDPAGFSIGKRVYIVVDEDRQATERRLSEWFQRRYGRPGMESCAIWGPPAECIDRLHEVTETGTELIILDAPFDHAEQLERFASEIAPRLS